tara:strand:- start:908 stop:1783 length:876 start_codon:yes stop_codon:yes gene_type:complete
MGFRAKKPQTRYGNTFGNVGGSFAELEDWDYPGDIDYGALSRRRFKNQTDFTEFYKSVKDFVLARLGFPVVRVELTEFQIQTAIDEAVSKLDYHAPDWCVQFCTFATSAGVSLYELPQVVMNNFRNAVYRKNLLSVAQSNGTLEFDFFIKYFQDNFLFRDFSVGDYYVTISHLEMMRKILGNDGTFNVVNGRYLNIAPTPTGVFGEVIVEFKALDTGTLHPYFINWLQRYSLSVAKGILGQIRGKYQTLPSPAGGAQLNGEALIQQSSEEQQKLVEELLTEIEEPPTFTTF